MSGIGFSISEDDDRPETPIRRMSRRFSIIFSKISPGGGHGGRGKGGRESQEVGIVEHRENSASRPGRLSWGTVGTGSEAPKSPRERP